MINHKSNWLDIQFGEALPDKRGIINQEGEIERRIGSHRGEVNDLSTRRVSKTLITDSEQEVKENVAIKSTVQTRYYKWTEKKQKKKQRGRINKTKQKKSE